MHKISLTKKIKLFLAHKKLMKVWDFLTVFVVFSNSLLALGSKVHQRKKMSIVFCIA